MASGDGRCALMTGPTSPTDCQSLELASSQEHLKPRTPGDMNLRTPDRRSPSQVTGAPWVRAYAPAAEAEQEVDPTWVGKWLLFIPEAHADRIWAEIRDATEAGELGVSAKAATAEQDHPRGNVVMCVYTADCRDLADVGRVLAVLRDQGHGGRLNYKEDLATYAGRYEGGDGPASLYTSPSGALIKTLRPVTDPGPAEV